MRSGGRGAPRPAAGARGQGGQGGQGDQVMERRSSPRAPSVHIYPMIQPQVPPSALALPHVQRLGTAGRSLLCWASVPLICPQPAHCPGRPCSSQPLLSSGQLRLYAPALQSQGSWGLCVCVCVCCGGEGGIHSDHEAGGFMSLSRALGEHCALLPTEGGSFEEESGLEHILLDSAPCWLSLSTGATHPLLPSFLPSFIHQ